MDNLSIPALQGDEFIIMIKTYGWRLLVMPATDDATNCSWVRCAWVVPREAKNLKFNTGMRGATPNYDAVNEGRTRGTTARPPAPMPGLQPAST